MEPVPSLEISPIEYTIQVIQVRKQKEYKTIKTKSDRKRVLGLTPLVNSPEWSTEREQSACFGLFTSNYMCLRLFEHIYIYNYSYNYNYNYVYICIYIYICVCLRFLSLSGCRGGESQHLAGRAGRLTLLAADGCWTSCWISPVAQCL